MVEPGHVLPFPQAPDGIELRHLRAFVAHCKYSSKSTPGARIDDLYDVSGQAMKMNRAKSIPELLTRRLLRRERNRIAAGKSGIIVGDIQSLAAVVNEARFRKAPSDDRNRLGGDVGDGR
jgi:hypothetical protein